MADGDVLADLQVGAAGAVRPVMGDVQHRAVLHIAARADADAVDVAAHHRHRPQRHVVAQLDIADQLRRRVDIDTLPQARQCTAVRPDHCPFPI